MIMYSGKAWIGIGANLGEPKTQVLQAIDRLDREDKLTVEARSSLYRTAPIGGLDQPDFITAVVRAEVAVDPLALLRRLLVIESEFGRVRDGSRNAPRLLDLDLLMYEDQTVDTEELIVPHPMMHQRLFVLRPLLELEGEMHIVGVGSLGACANECGDQRTIRLDSLGSELVENG